MDTKWIAACGMRRAGSTLQYHLVREVLSGIDYLDLRFLVWQGFDEAYKKHDGKYPYIVFKSHTHTPSFSAKCASMWVARGYGLFIHRDVRDVLASLTRMYSTSNPDSPLLAPELLKNDMECIVNLESRRWIATSNTLVTRYEDILTVDGIAIECKRIAEHIGVSIDDERCAEIAEEYTVSKQKERLPQLAKYNNEFLLWWNHIFTGETGRWKEELTPAQIALCNSLNLPKELVRE
jgi:hypothetical protein